jgi:hypothetical protein
MWIGTNPADAKMLRPPCQDEMKYIVVAHGMPLRYSEFAEWLKSPDNVDSASRRATYGMCPQAR